MELKSATLTNPLLFTGIKELREQTNWAILLIEGYLATKPRGYVFIKQYFPGDHTAWFFCRKINLLIEITISESGINGKMNTNRQQTVGEKDVKTLCFTNEEINQQLNTVIRKIKYALHG